MFLKTNLYFIKIILIILISFVSFKIFPQNDTNEISIESMRNRNYKGSIIIIEKKIFSNNSYSSYVISYRSDGLKQYALLNIPKLKKKKYPVVVVNHGYIHPDAYSTEKSYKTISAYFASKGFLVIKPDYRGHDKSEKGSGAFFDHFSYAVDVINLIYSLESLPAADMNNIFLFGHSMGGEVSVYVLETIDKIKAVSLWAPLLAEYPENVLYYVKRRDKTIADRMEELLFDDYKEDDFKKFSLLYNSKYINSPILIRHSKIDRYVPYKWTIEFIKNLEKNKKKYKFISYNDENHNLSRRSFFKALSDDADFFKKHIK